VSSLLAWVGGCTEPNPAFVGIEGAADSSSAPEPEPTPEPDAGAGDGPEVIVDAGVDAADSSPAPEADAEADTAAPADAPAIPVNGLVAYWPLDEAQGTIARDATGNLNDGTLLNDPTWIATAPAGASLNPSALHLDGADDYVEVTPRTLPRAEAAKTISVWFRNSASSPRLRNLVAFFNDQGNTGIHLGFETNLVAVWRYGDFDPVIASATAPDGGWHHLAYTWDGSTHRLYLDGSAIGTSTIGMKNGAVATARLGAWQVPDEMFIGDLDDVRVYDRPLSDAEIAALAGR